VSAPCRFPVALAATVLACVLGGCAGGDESAFVIKAAPATDAAGADAAVESRERTTAALGLPASLHGLEEAGLTRLFGPASFRRSDGPAEMLQYRDDTCVLDVFLYPGAGAGPARVEHALARDQALRLVPEAACVRSLVGTRRARPAG
jgi:hypothetical protein